MAVRTISQRELRNDNAEVIRAVERGESLTVTRRGVAVARLVPVEPEGDLDLVRPARARRRWAELERVRLDVPTSEILEDLRGER